MLRLLTDPMVIKNTHLSGT